MTTFTSKSASLSIVVSPVRRRVDSNGDSYLTEGKRAAFRDGMFSTDDQEIINFLKAHRDFGVLFTSDDEKISSQEMESKAEAKHKKERALASKTEKTNKKLPSEGGKVDAVDPESEEGISGQFVNEDNLIA